MSPGNPFDGIKWVWMNGRLVEFAKATVHVMAHAMHYGSGLFEGIRKMSVLLTMLLVT